MLDLHMVRELSSFFLCFHRSKKIYNMLVLTLFFIYLFISLDVMMPTASTAVGAVASLAAAPAVEEKKVGLFLI